MEILVKAISDTHENPDIDRVSCFKKGFPVVIMPDDWTWGADEGLPLFVIIKVPGVTISDEYVLPRTDGIDERGKPIKTLCRDYTFPENLIDAAIDSEGVFTLTGEQFLGYIQKVE